MADELTGAEAHTDFSKLKVNDLKKILKSRGLSTVGNKGELVERLTKSQSEEAPDELLDGIGGGDSEVDDLEVEDLDESALMSDEKEISSQSIKRKAAEDEDDKTEEEPPNKTKKVVLNRKPEVALKEDEDNSKGDGSSDEKTETTNGKAESTTEKSSATSESSRIIKISELTTKDKLQLRSQKFGLSESAKKELRAARFGIPTKTVMTEALKKRAERFGIKEITAPTVQKTDSEDKLLARKNKFSAVTSPTTVTAPSSALDEKKLLRAQRFKLAT